MGAHADAKHHPSTGSSLTKLLPISCSLPKYCSSVLEDNIESVYDPWLTEQRQGRSGQKNYRRYKQSNGLSCTVCAELLVLPHTTAQHEPGIQMRSVSRQLIRKSLLHPRSSHTPRGGRMTAQMNLVRRETGVGGHTHIF